MARILILDDDEKRHLVYKSRYAKHEVVHALTYSEAVNHLDAGRFDLVHLDHDLADFGTGEEYPTMYGGKVEYTGADVARHIANMPRERRPSQVILHSWNDVGVKNMHNILRDKVAHLDVQRFNVKG